eukprot:6214406-Pleurochrysis_carterae.AAC.6
MALSSTWLLALAACSARTLALGVSRVLSSLLALWRSCIRALVLAKYLNAIKLCRNGGVTRGCGGSSAPLLARLEVGGGTICATVAASRHICVCECLSLAVLLAITRACICALSFLTAFAHLRALVCSASCMAVVAVIIPPAHACPFLLHRLRACATFRSVRLRQAA